MVLDKGGGGELPVNMAFAGRVYASLVQAIAETVPCRIQVSKFHILQNGICAMWF